MRLEALIGFMVLYPKAVEEYRKLYGGLHGREQIQRMKETGIVNWDAIEQLVTEGERMRRFVDF